MYSYCMDGVTTHADHFSLNDAIVAARQMIVKNRPNKVIVSTCHQTVYEYSSHSNQKVKFTSTVTGITNSWK